MKRVDAQNNHFSKRTAILIALCVVLVAFVTIIGANWDLISLAKISGKKQPANYTWEEFSALPPLEKDAFAESFDSQDEFVQWVDSITPSNNDQNSTADCPWENGGKQPQEYTWSEFLALSPELQNTFADTFENTEAFTTWQKTAQDNDNSLALPWKNGGKQPNEYTWEDFLALTATEKDAFYLAFPTTEDYNQWLNRVNP